MVYEEAIMKLIEQFKVQIAAVKDIGSQLLVDHNFQSIDVLNRNVRDDRFIRLGIAFPYIGESKV